MKNERVIIAEDGTKLKIEIILAFNIEQNNKDYIAYTVNDDDSETAIVLISEIDYNTNRIKSINLEEKDLVLDAYEELKNTIMNE